jgi:glycosyltransferase involved in cell wall biosynthesis
VPRPRLSAALIVKNEERFLADCLRSLRGVADEVVVVDTGSEDRSPQIAREGKVRLHEFAWTGDFAAARNEALRLCRGMWILYIDADERVRADSCGDLDQLLTDSAKIGYYVRFQVRPGFTPYREMRLFRNDPRIRFQGVIHENIWPGIRNRQSSAGGEIGESALLLEHLGYEGDQRQKHFRNLPLLLESLKRDPARVFNWCHLARVYSGLDDHEHADKAWRAGVDVVREKDAVHPGDAFPYLGLIESLMSREQDVTSLLQEAIALFPGNLQLLWLRGRQLMKKERYRQAIPLFQQLLTQGKAEDFDLWVAYDRRIFGIMADDSLATCYLRLGEYAEGKKHFESASRAEPDNKEYRLKQHLCERLLASSAREA